MGGNLTKQKIMTVSQTPEFRDLSGEDIQGVIARHILYEFPSFRTEKDIGDVAETVFDGDFI
jgi:hypothetical protein